MSFDSLMPKPMVVPEAIHTVAVASAPKDAMDFLPEPMQEPLSDLSADSRPASVYSLSGSTNSGTGRDKDCCATPRASLANDAMPIHLLRPSADHRCLVPDPGAFRKLEALGPVAVVSLVGAQRAGKSTLMNLLHNRATSGFQIGHFMDPQTHGLWVWPRPHPRRPGMTVLLVDSEGLDSPHVPPHYQWLVAAVTLLISDIFMYQTKGSIEQSSAERLDMILKISEQLGKVSSGDASNNEGAFLWLLRDHQLQMKSSPKDELNSKLDPAQLDVLRRSFGEYDCVPLPRPASADQLRNLDRHRFEELCPDFREEYVVFERRLFQMVSEPRTFLGSKFDGAALVEILSQYLDSIDRRQGVLADICQIPSQGDLLRQLGGKRAVEAGVCRYEDMLAKLGVRGGHERSPLSSAEVMASHHSARCAALESFEEEAGVACLDEADREHARGSLEERLACWGTRLQLAGAADLEGGSVSAAEEEAAPMIVRVDELRGGLLKDIWCENARRSHAAYEAWLARALVPKKVREDLPAASCAKERPDALESYYSQIQEVLAGTERDNSELGPWAAGLHSSVGGEIGRQLLLGVAKNSNAIVLNLAKEAATQQSAVLRFEMQQKQAECATAFKEEIQRLEALIHASTADLKERLASTEERCVDSALKQANANMKEGLMATKELAAKAITDLEETTMRMRSKTEARMLEQQERVDDLERQVRQLRDDHKAAHMAVEQRMEGEASRMEEAFESLRISREELNDQLRECRSDLDAFLSGDEQRAEKVKACEAALADLKGQLKDCASAAEDAAEANKAEFTRTGEAILRLRGCFDAMDAQLKQVQEAQTSQNGRLTEVARKASEDAESMVKELSGKSASFEATFDRSMFEFREELEVIKNRNELSAIWESFAHLSLEVNNMQVEVKEMDSRLPSPPAPKGTASTSWRR